MSGIPRCISGVLVDGQAFQCVLEHEHLGPHIAELPASLADISLVQDVELTEEFLVAGADIGALQGLDDAFEEEKRRALCRLLRRIAEELDRFFDLHGVGPCEFEKESRSSVSDLQLCRWTVRIRGELKEAP